MSAKLNLFRKILLLMVLLAALGAVAAQGGDPASRSKKSGPRKNLSTRGPKKSQPKQTAGIVVTGPKRKASTTPVRTRKKLLQTFAEPPVTPGEGDNAITSTLRCQNLLQQANVEAEDVCRKALQLNAGSALSNLNLGAALSRQRKYVEAELYYREAVRLEPRDRESNCSLGSFLNGRLKYAEAERYFRESLRLELEEPPLLSFWQCEEGLIKALEQQQKYVEALPLKRSLAESYTRSGNAALALKDYKQARFCYREAIRWEPDNILYQENLKRIPIDPPKKKPKKGDDIP
jgi:predicted Zn-dependent protease